ncbi:hypothetical protein QJQ45_010064 [Haematococcus lacustris]|nr:hypothetical protein QJQ45_010064 [Haematococcus lacustris]
MAAVAFVAPGSGNALGVAATPTNSSQKHSDLARGCYANRAALTAPSLVAAAKACGLGLPPPFARSISCAECQCELLSALRPLTAAVIGSQPVTAFNSLPTPAAVLPQPPGSYPSPSPAHSPPSLTATQVLTACLPVVLQAWQALPGDLAQAAAQLAACPWDSAAATSCTAASSSFSSANKRDEASTSIVGSNPGSSSSMRDMSPGSRFDPAAQPLCHPSSLAQFPDACQAGCQGVELTSLVPCITLLTPLPDPPSPAPPAPGMAPIQPSHTLLDTPPTPLLHPPTPSASSSASAAAAALAQLLNHQGLPTSPATSPSSTLTPLSTQLPPTKSGPLPPTHPGSDPHSSSSSSSSLEVPASSANLLSPPTGSPGQAEWAMPSKEGPAATWAPPPAAFGAPPRGALSPGGGWEPGLEPDYYEVLYEPFLEEEAEHGSDDRGAWGGGGGAALVVAGPPATPGLLTWAAVISGAPLPSPALSPVDLPAAAAELNVSWALRGPPKAAGTAEAATSAAAATAATAGAAAAAAAAQAATMLQAVGAAVVVPGAAPGVRPVAAAAAQVAEAAAAMLRAAGNDSQTGSGSSLAAGQGLGPAAGPGPQPWMQVLRGGNCPFSTTHLLQSLGDGLVPFQLDSCSPALCFLAQAVVAAATSQHAPAPTLDSPSPGGPPYTRPNPPTPNPTASNSTVQEQAALGSRMQGGLAGVTLSGAMASSSNTQMPPPSSHPSTSHPPFPSSPSPSSSSSFSSLPAANAMDVATIAALLQVCTQPLATALLASGGAASLAAVTQLTSSCPTTQGLAQLLQDCPLSLPLSTGQSTLSVQVGNTEPGSRAAAAATAAAAWPATAPSPAAPPPGSVKLRDMWLGSMQRPAAAREGGSAGAGVGEASSRSLTPSPNPSSSSSSSSSWVFTASSVQAGQRASALVTQLSQPSLQAPGGTTSTPTPAQDPALTPGLDPAPLQPPGPVADTNSGATMTWRAACACSDMAWQPVCAEGNLAWWLDRDPNGCLNFQRSGESMQRPLKLCSRTNREALPPIGKEYQQGFKLVNDRLPMGRQQLQRPAEYRRGIDGRARYNA